jgi:para-nitrobenzyl esterase
VFAWTQNDYKVSGIMQEYFANFIKKGDPNGDPLPKWPAADTGKTIAVMHIAVFPHIVQDKFRDRYLLLEKIEKKNEKKP